MAFGTLKILDYAVYCPGILVLIHHKRSGRTNNLRQQLSPAQLARVSEQTIATEQEIARCELETAIKSSIISWQADPSATPLDNIDACLNYLRQSITEEGW